MTSFWNSIDAPCHLVTNVHYYISMNIQVSFSFPFPHFWDLSIKTNACWLLLTKFELNRFSYEGSVREQTDRHYITLEELYWRCWEFIWRDSYWYKCLCFNFPNFNVYKCMYVYVYVWKCVCAYVYVSVCMCVYISDTLLLFFYCTE